MNELESELCVLIVEALLLEDVTASDIDPAAPLFGEGLGLDSIDALELALAIEKKYGVRLKSTDESRVHFSSVRTLAAHVAAERPA